MRLQNLLSNKTWDVALQNAGIQTAEDLLNRYWETALVAELQRFGISEEDIERMVREAEDNREADVAQREQVDARNGLEQYCYNVRNTLSSSDELKDKIGEEDAQTIVTTVDEALVHLRKWPF